MYICTYIDNAQFHKFHKFQVASRLRLAFSGPHPHTRIHVGSLVPPYAAPYTYIYTDFFVRKKKNACGEREIVCVNNKINVNLTLAQCCYISLRIITSHKQTNIHTQHTHTHIQD